MNTAVLMTSRDIWKEMLQTGLENRSAPGPTLEHVCLWEKAVFKTNHIRPELLL